MSDNVFKLARTKYNQHGPQSVETVAKSTSLSKTMIDDLESNVGKKRGVSYLKIAELAKYYGVSSDYLLELDPTPSSNAEIRKTVQETGLSVNSLFALKSNCQKIRSPQIPKSKLSDYERAIDLEIETCTEIAEQAKKEGWDFDLTEVISLRKQELFDEYTEPETFSAELILYALNTLIEKESQIHILHNIGLFLGTRGKVNDRYFLSINDNQKSGYFYCDAAITPDDISQIFLLNIQRELLSLRSETTAKYHISEIGTERESLVTFNDD